MTPAILSALIFGLAVGIQHAFEPDHVAALGTLLPAEASPANAAVQGAWWGVGHSLSVMAVGVPLILVGAHVPGNLESLAEGVVALMLILLGARALWRAHRLLPPSDDHGHTHGASLHHDAPGGLRRALPVGMIHGLAGSGAAVILATTAAPSTLSASLFLALFGAGSIGGMALAAAVLSVPILKWGTGARRRHVFALSGVLSVLVGLIWGGPLVLDLLT